MKKQIGILLLTLSTFASSTEMFAAPGDSLVDPIDDCISRVCERIINAQRCLTALAAVKPETKDKTIAYINARYKTHLDFGKKLPKKELDALGMELDAGGAPVPKPSA